MNYLIIYNHTQITFNPNDIHKTITTMLGITDWWHYLPNAYIVSTDRNQEYIADNIIASYPGLLFLIVAVNLQQYNGVLNKKAWEWISKKARIFLRVKPAPQPPPLADPLRSLLFPKPILRSQKTIQDLLMEAMRERAGGK